MSDRDRHRSLRRASRALLSAVVGVIGLMVYAGTANAERPAPSGPNGRLPTTGTTLPPGPLQVRLTPIATAEQPLAVVQRVGDDALYVVEKTGRIRAWRNGVFAEPSVLDIRARVDSTNERGLLGLAFRPGHDDVLYVDYTDRRGHVIVSELPFDATTTDIGRERVLLDIPKPFNEHNAGTLAFDAKGALLIAIGDGGGSGDKYNNGQRTDVLLGKILRIDPTPSGSLAYSIPPDNPFTKPTLGGAKARGEVFAFGLRNPWRMSVDQTTGDVWVPDVGQDSFEEINRIAAGQSGQNFGWRMREGKQRFSGSRPRNSTDPVYDYPHADGRCAVVGGAVYRGSAMPQLVGWYVFGDVCSGNISALNPAGGGWHPVSLGAHLSYLTAFGTGSDGELYATSLEGAVVRLGL